MLKRVESDLVVEIFAKGIKKGHILPKIHQVCLVHLHAIGREKPNRLLQCLVFIVMIF